MRTLVAAFRFLTILPVPGQHHVAAADDAAGLAAGWGRATAWYPAVGLVLGAFLGGLDWGLRQVWPAGVASALTLCGWVALTGALHLDGLADCCDALLPPLPSERRLDVLRDVHVGAFGIVGVVLLLLVKYTALVALPAALRLPTLLITPALGRWGMTVGVICYRYARPGPGLGSMAKAGAGWRQLAVATLTVLLAGGLAAWIGLGWLVPALLTLTAVAIFLTAQWMQARLGGLTGDTYGALCELGETVCLLVVSSLFLGGIVPR